MGCKEDGNRLSLDKHLDFPKCEHEGCGKQVYMFEGIVWRFCHEHRMDYFKENKVSM